MVGHVSAVFSVGDVRRLVPDGIKGYGSGVKVNVNAERMWR
jgi:hypothetical protein